MRRFRVVIEERDERGSVVRQTYGPLIPLRALMLPSVAVAESFAKAVEQLPMPAPEAPHHD